MEKQVNKSVRLPKAIIRQIEKVVHGEGSTVTQFIRTATITALKQRRVA